MRNDTERPVRRLLHDFSRTAGAPGVRFVNRDGGANVKKADRDGVYVLKDEYGRKHRFRARLGDVIPEGAEMADASAPATAPETPAAKRRGRPAASQQAQRGPSETTEAAGPTETAAVAPTETAAVAPTETAAVAPTEAPAEAAPADKPASDAGEPATAKAD